MQPSGQPAPVPLVDSNELQAVKTALDADITDAGVGVLHLPTNRVHLQPVSQLHPPGHDALVQQLHLDRAECRGFVIAKTPAGEFVVENVSGLNVGSGGPTSLAMPQPLFDNVKLALMAARL
jgi:hypothetical protein